MATKTTILTSCFRPSFSFVNRTARFLWRVFYTVLFRYTPKFCYPWRAFILKCFGASIGKNCHIYPSADIWAPWNLICEDYVVIGENVRVYNQAVVKICNKVVISQGCFLCTGTHNYTDPAFQLITKPITIMENSWLCAEVFVLPGVTIGSGAVIGARATVTKDMPTWMVSGGSPCRPIKKRGWHPSNL